MKSQRRHELQENVLAQELGKLGQFFNKYGGWVFVAVLLVALAVLLVVYFASHAEKERTAEQATFDQLIRPREPISEQDQLKGLENLIQSAKDPVIAANAAVFAGDMKSAQFMQAVDRKASDQEELYKQARGYYETVLNRWPDRPLLTAKAHFGLGILAENHNDPESARKEYEYVTKALDSSYSLHNDAQRRLTQLPEWVKGVKLATTSQAASTSAPASSPAASAPAASTLSPAGTR